MLISVIFCRLFLQWHKSANSTSIFLDCNTHDDYWELWTFRVLTALWSCFLCFFSADFIIFLSLLDRAAASGDPSDFLFSSGVILENLDLALCCRRVSIFSWTLGLTGPQTYSVDTESSCELTELLRMFNFEPRLRFTEEAGGIPESDKLLPDWVSVCSAAACSAQLS